VVGRTPQGLFLRRTGEPLRFFLKYLTVNKWRMGEYTSAWICNMNSHLFTILRAQMEVPLINFHSSLPTFPSSCYAPLYNYIPIFPSNCVAILFTGMFVVITFTIPYCMFHDGFWLTFSPRKWKRNINPKRHLTLTELHGVVSRKTELFIGQLARANKGRNCCDITPCIKWQTACFFLFHYLLDNADEDIR
jgi:hypothetical protein